MSLTEPVTVPLTAPVNLRDLAGIRIAGRVVRSGFAIRADDLAIVNEEVADRLVADGLRAIIDLRSADEVALTGRGPLGTRTAVNYHHIPLLADLGRAAEPAELLEQSRFGRMYLRMYEGAAVQIVAALAVIAHAPGTVAFHCAAGQDRTGVLAAALLLALGADDEAIIADYARTGENSAAIIRRITPIMAPLLARHGLDLDRTAEAATRAGFSDVPMRELVTSVTARHGDPLAPLRGAGLTNPIIDRLRERGLVHQGDR